MDSEEAKEERVAEIEAEREIFVREVQDLRFGFTAWERQYDGS